jgi:hypothetical protein
MALLLAGVLACCATGLFVLRKRPGDSTNRVFFALMTFFALWDLMEFAAIVTLGGEMAAAWMRHLAVPLTLSAAALCHFSLLFPEPSPLSRKSWIAIALYLPAILVGLVDIALSFGLAPSISPAMISFSWGVALTKTHATTIVKLLLVGYLAVLGKNLAHSYRISEDSLARGQIRSIFAGLILPAFLGAIAIVVIRFLTPLQNTVHAAAKATGLGGKQFICYPYGLFPAIFVIVSLFIAYAILRYGFLEIRVIVNRMIFLTVLTSVLACIYVVVSELLEDIFKGWLHDDSRASGIAAALVVAAFFSPVTTWISHFVQKIFLREVSDFRDAADEACNGLGLSSSIESAAEIAVNLFSGIDGVLGARLLLADGTDAGSLQKEDYREKLDETAIELSLGERHVGNLILSHPHGIDLHWVKGSSQRFIAMLTMAIAQSSSARTGNKIDPVRSFLVSGLARSWARNYSGNSVATFQNRTMKFSREMNLENRLGVLSHRVGHEATRGLIFQLTGDIAACGIAALAIYHDLIVGVSGIGEASNPSKLNSSESDSPESKLSESYTEILTEDVFLFISALKKSIENDGVVKLSDAVFFSFSGLVDGMVDLTLIRLDRTTERVMLSADDKFDVFAGEQHLSIEFGISSGTIPNQ